MSAFPKNPEDNTIFEPYENIFYIYKSKLNGWIELKGFNKPDIVSYRSMGLMSKEQFEKLEKIIIPPYDTTINIGDTKYESGSVTIHGETPINVTKSINPDIPYNVVDNTGFIDFNIDITKFYEQFLESKQITHEIIQGDIGDTGKTGGPGEDNLIAGPTGDSGKDGKNSSFAGDLSPDPIEYRPLQSEKAISDIYSYQHNENKTVINALRSYVGNPELCCSGIKIHDFISPYVILAEPDKVREMQNKECVLCYNLYYINIETLINKIKDKYQSLIDDYVSKSIMDCIEWLKFIIKSFNEQKQALCCALEYCETRKRNIEERRFIEENIINATYNNRILELTTPNISTASEDSSQKIDSKEFVLNPELNYDENHAIILDLEDNIYIFSVSGFLKFKGKYFSTLEILENGVSDKLYSGLLESEDDVIWYNQTKSIMINHEKDNSVFKIWLPINPDMNKDLIEGTLTINVVTKASIDEKRPDYSDIVYMYGNKLEGDSFKGIISSFVGGVSTVDNLNEDGTVIYGPDELKISTYEYSDGLRFMFYRDSENTAIYIISKKESDVPSGSSNSKIHVEVVDNKKLFGVLKTIGDPKISVSNNRYDYGRAIDVDEDKKTTPDLDYKEGLTYYEFKGKSGEIPTSMATQQFRVLTGPQPDPIMLTIRMDKLSKWLNRGNIEKTESGAQHYENGMIVQPNTDGNGIWSEYDKLNDYFYNENKNRKYLSNYNTSINNPLDLPNGLKRNEFLFPINIPSFIEEVKDLKLYFDIDLGRIDFWNVDIEIRPPAFYKVIENGQIKNYPISINSWGNNYSNLNIDISDNPIIYCDNSMCWKQKYVSFVPGKIDPKWGNDAMLGYKIEAELPEDLEFITTGRYGVNVAQPWYASPMKLSYLGETGYRDPFHPGGSGSLIRNPAYIKVKSSGNKFSGYIEIKGSGLESYDKFVKTGDVDFEIFDHNKWRLETGEPFYFKDSRSRTKYSESLSEYIQQWQHIKKRWTNLNTGEQEHYDENNEIVKKHPYGGGTWWLVLTVHDNTNQVKGPLEPYQKNKDAINSNQRQPGTPTLRLNDWGLIVGTDIVENKTTSGIFGNALDIEFNTKDTTEAVILGNLDNDNDSDYILTVEIDDINNVEDAAIYTERGPIRDEDIFDRPQKIDLLKPSKHPDFNPLIFNKNPLGCRMHYKMVEWYERGWRTGACCGVLIEEGTQQYIIMKRSLKEDMSCGGGETYNGCIGKYVLANKPHPYLMFPTDDGETFSNKLGGGSVRLIEDSTLSDILILKIKNNEVIKVKGDIEFIKEDIKLILFQSIITE